MSDQPHYRIGKILPILYHEKVNSEFLIFCCRGEGDGCHHPPLTPANLASQFLAQRLSDNLEHRAISLAHALNFFGQFGLLQ